MRLKLIQPVVIAGHPGLGVGDIFEDSDRGLLAFCVEVNDEPVKETPRPVVDPFVVENREPELENRDPVPKRFKKKLP